MATYCRKSSTIRIVLAVLGNFICTVETLWSNGTILSNNLIKLTWRNLLISKCYRLSKTVSKIVVAHIVGIAEERVQLILYEYSFLYDAQYSMKCRFITEAKQCEYILLPLSQKLRVFVSCQRVNHNILRIFCIAKKKNNLFQ